MGLFKSLKGKVDVGTGTQSPSETTNEQYQQQQSHDGWSTSQEKRRLFGRNNDPDNHLSSSSAGQGRRQGTDDLESYAPPPGPPPSHRGAVAPEQNDTFLPPPGPPPSHSSQRGHVKKNNDHDNEDFQPPPGPPPSSSRDNPNPPPYHDWTVIPDTSLLPPPPPLPQDYSPTNNASYDSAERAHAWCAANPVYTPSRPAHEIHLLANAGHLTLEPPPAGPLRKSLTLRQSSPSQWTVATKSGQQDTIILTHLPVFFAAVDSPLVTGRPKTIYFEIRVRRVSNTESGIALGFAAKPYPVWRLPGWHRASWAVHGDDGRRFVNDSWGGREFVDAFRPGEVVGVGMRFSPSSSEEAGSGVGVEARAFITRDGRGKPDDPRWSWDLDEERDERDEGVYGLRGDGDLYPAIGVFGAVEFDVSFGDSVLWTGR